MSFELSFKYADGEVIDVHVSGVVPVGHYRVNGHVHHRRTEGGGDAMPYIALTSPIATISAHLNSESIEVVD